MYNHFRWTKTFNYHVNLVKYEQSPSLGTTHRLFFRTSEILFECSLTFAGLNFLQLLYVFLNTILANMVM